MPAAIVGFLFPGLVGTLAGSLVAGVIGIGISFGLNYLAQSLRKKPKPEDVKGVFRQSAAPRRRHLGRVLTGGHIVFLETEKGNLHQVTVFGLGPVDGYEQFYVDGKPITLGAGLSEIQFQGNPLVLGWAVEEPYRGKSIFVATRPGTTSQAAFSTLTIRFPTLWTTEHRLRGLAAALVMQHSVDQEDFSKIYQGQISAVTVRARWGSIYDPRTRSSKFSANAALILRDYLVNSDGARISASLIDDTLFSTAANVCDEVVPTKDGGTIKRYEIGLSYDLDAEPRSVIDRVLTAMDGRMFLTPEGKIGLHAGKWVAPTVTLTDEHILDFDIVDGAGQFADANEVILKFSYAAAKYSDASADPWRDEAAISEQGQVRSVSVEAYEVQHHNHARRIAKIIQKRSSPRYKGTIVTTLKGLECYDQRWIRLSCADLGILPEAPEAFEVIDVGLNVDAMTVVLTVQSFDGSAYPFDAATEEGQAPIIPDDLELGTIAAPAICSAARYAIKLSDVEVPDPANPSTKIKVDVNAYVLQISITSSSRPDLKAELQYKASSGANWLNIPPGDAFWVGQSPPLERGVTYNTRGRYRGLGGGASAWTNGPNVVVPA